MLVEWGVEIYTKGPRLGESGVLRLSTPLLPISLQTVGQSLH
jgi:hypothetical protein